MRTTPTFRPQDFPVVDDLLDWLIDKQRQGWKMVDSIPRLQNMKGFMRGVGEQLGMPRRTELVDHPNGWNSCPVLPHVQREVRLGHGRESEIRPKATRGDEARL